MNVLIVCSVLGPFLTNVLKQSRKTVMILFHISWYSVGVDRLQDWEEVER